VGKIIITRAPLNPSSDYNTAGAAWNRQALPRAAEKDRTRCLRRQRVDRFPSIDVRRYRGIACTAMLV
jgi:hypothetical protein